MEETPQFTHDCDTCRFIGRINGFDVWMHDTEPRSLIARYGNEGSEYTSVPPNLFRSWIAMNGILQVGVGYSFQEMRWRDYIVSDKAIPAHRAFLVALVMDSNREL